MKEKNTEQNRQLSILLTRDEREKMNNLMRESGQSVTWLIRNALQLSYFGKGVKLPRQKEMFQ